MNESYRWVLGFYLVLVFVLHIPVETSASGLTGTEQEAKIRAFFKDDPAMIDIARCESGLRQHTASGDVLRGGAGQAMIGVFQLHEKYHRGPALALGFDIDTLEGNMAYANVLREKEGLQPWGPCLHAVNEEVSHEDAPTTTLDNTREILIARIRDLERQVKLLQIQLLQRQVLALQSRFNR